MVILNVFEIFGINIKTTKKKKKAVPQVYWNLINQSFIILSLFYRIFIASTHTSYPV